MCYSTSNVRVGTSGWKTIHPELGDGDVSVQTETDNKPSCREQLDSLSLGELNDDMVVISLTRIWAAPKRRSPFRNEAQFPRTFGSPER
jgi:hypothetical protein